MVCILYINNCCCDCCRYLLQVYAWLLIHGVHLSGLEVVFDAVLEAFAFNFHGCDDQRVAKEMCRISNTFIGFKTERQNTQILYGLSTTLVCTFDSFTII